MTRVQEALHDKAARHPLTLNVRQHYLKRRNLLCPRNQTAPCEESDGSGSNIPHVGQTNRFRDLKGEMMRRNDTRTIGRAAEDEATTLLQQRGFTVQNMNDVIPNHPVYDLEAVRAGRLLRVSVKAARAKREIRLGKVESLRQVGDKYLVMLFLPVRKGVEISFNDGGYELLLVPGGIARDQAIDAHLHYCIAHPHNIDHPAMVKDKIDRSPHTKSGAVFHSWRNSYLNAWHVIDELVQ